MRRTLAMSAILALGVSGAGPAAASALAIPPPAAPASAPPGAPGVAASAAPSGAATPKPPLREIGHVRAQTPYCAAIERHFNAVVHPMLENDVKIGAIDYTLGALRAHFADPARELKLTTDRLNLTAYAASVETSIPELEREIQALRLAEKSTGDPEQAKLAHDLAAELQKSLDRQRQIAIDTAGVAQALLDEEPATKMLGDPQDAVRQSDGSDTVAQEDLVSADADAHETAAATTTRGWSDVRDYLRLQRQLDRIGDAEGAAAALADRAFTLCGQ